MINLIYACDKNNAIGINNKLPWNIPSDLIRFKALTENSTIVMGRNTYESLPMYPKGLPNRTNIVVSRSIVSNEYVTVVNNLDEYLSSQEDNKEVWVIGGSEVYRQAIPYVKMVYQTLIETEVDKADAWFDLKDYPEFKRRSCINVTIDTKEDFKTKFIIYSKD